ncbi:hypothetical protein HK097_003216 [Rhizophlyctis rosea]|uniref:Minichromosome loss protein Mcl1 middle region domain-containing protein n=1 Tax=Rhizophlyctis rosea TaxID=64517 RepID=A0AAD5S4G9_9FUNG|nr:hypothetical protein HK097_003216 [Rhizophlyctis rosea]
MAACGDLLFVVYHVGGVYHGNQNLAYILYNLQKEVTVKKDALPISKGSLLTWVGISEIGMPATYDTNGIVRVLLPYGDFQWIPVLDSTMAKRARSEESATIYWPVDVTDREFMCVVCKGADKHPHFPKPLITELPLTIPFAMLETPIVQLEEKYWKGAVVARHLRGLSEGGDVGREAEIGRRDLEMDKILVQLILAACKAERVERALDLCRCLQSLKSLDGAIKIAVHHHLPGLAERMSLVKEAKIKKMREEEERSQASLFDHSYSHSMFSQNSVTTIPLPSIGGMVGTPFEEPNPPTPLKPLSHRTPLRPTPSRPAQPPQSDPVSPSNNDEDEQHVEGPKQRTGFSRTPKGSEKKVEKSRNPFAVGERKSGGGVGAGLMGGKTLFEAINQVAGAKSHETKSRNANLEGVKKRKSEQGTLFGFVPGEDAPPAEKKNKRAKKGDGESSEAGSSSNGGQSFIAGFLGVRQKEREKSEQAPESESRDADAEDNAREQVQEEVREEVLDGEPMEMEGAEPATDGGNAASGVDDGEMDWEVPLRRDKGKGSVVEGGEEGGGRLDRFKFQKK